MDTKVNTEDAVILTDALYDGMSITYAPVQREINGVMKNFGIVINGNFGTLEQIYEYVQYQLRSSGNINANTMGISVRGDTAEELLAFVADTLKTKTTMFGGVYIDNYRSIDINSIIFSDNLGNELVHPFIAAGTIKFNENIRNDANAKYWMFFTNDSAASVPTGKNYGTVNAVLVKDNSNVDITGSVGGNSMVTFDYDYNYNEQRGAGSADKQVPVTVVVQGLGTTQYTKAEGIIEKSVYNVFSMVGNLERNYMN